MTHSMPRKVIIVSSHPLFSRGLYSLLKKHVGQNIEVVGLATGVDEALQMIADHQPDLVVVDYDDQEINREDFLAHIICRSFQVRVVLFSLLEGGSQAIIYDRKTMAAARIDDWLHEPSGFESRQSSAE